MKLKKNLLKTVALVSIAGMPMVLASVPRSGQEVTNDTAIYQNLHEINIAKVKSVDFDSDIARLSAQEKSHRMPLQISAPMERVMSRPYSPTYKPTKRQHGYKHRR